jgi:hypothetical protein
MLQGGAVGYVIEIEAAPQEGEGQRTVLRERLRQWQRGSGPWSDSLDRYVVMQALRTRVRADKTCDSLVRAGEGVSLEDLEVL